MTGPLTRNLMLSIFSDQLYSAPTDYCASRLLGKKPFYLHSRLFRVVAKIDIFSSSVTLGCCVTIAPLNTILDLFNHRVRIYWFEWLRKGWNKHEGRLHHQGQRMFIRCMAGTCGILCFDGFHCWRIFLRTNVISQKQEALRSGRPWLLWLLGFHVLCRILLHQQSME